MYFVLKLFCTLFLFLYIHANVCVRLNLIRLTEGGLIWKQTDFHESAEMPTYMLSLTLADYKCLRVHVSAPKTAEVGICTAADSLVRARTTLDLLTQAVDYFHSQWSFDMYLPLYGTFISHSYFSKFCNFIRNIFTSKPSRSSCTTSSST